MTKCLFVLLFSIFDFACLASLCPTTFLFCPTKVVIWQDTCPFKRKKLFAALLVSRVSTEVNFFRCMLRFDKCHKVPCKTPVVALEFMFVSWSVLRLAYGDCFCLLVEYTS